MHAVLSVLQRSRDARSWEEYAACYTSATVPTLSFANKDGITRPGRAGWEMARPTREKHRNKQITVLGAILIAAKGQRHAFFYVIPSAITKLEPGQKMILTFVAVKDASRGWLLDRTLIDRSTLHLLSLDRPLDYVCYGKKQEFARLIPQIKDSYRREFIDGQSGFYHFPAKPQESGWIEWYPKKPKPAGGQPKANLHRIDSKS